MDTKKGFRFSATELKSKGRSSFQDAHGIVAGSDQDAPHLRVVVADGHGPCGEQASKTAVLAILDGAHGSPDARQLTAAFLAAHDLIDDDGTKGGCTATFAHIRPGKVTIGWVGNSEARLVKRDGKFRTLTIPHEFGVHRAETSRLIALGAEIQGPGAIWAHGCYDAKWQLERPKRGRVCVGNVSLEVSRALGDKEFDPFVLHEPEVREFALTTDDRFLIVASDGFWHPVTKRTSKRHLVERLLADSSDVDDAKDKLTDQFSKWPFDDDLTIVVIDLDT